MNIRIGLGTDSHRLEQGIPFVLGGIFIPFDKGPAGHSDGDALLHAICDALLGAAGLPDIGRNFPDTDPAFKGADSKQLLKKVFEMIKKEGWKLGNLDCSIHLQLPKLAPHIDEMKAVIANLLETDPSNIGLKAKTGEKTGPVGEGRVVEVVAVCLLVK